MAILYDLSLIHILAELEKAVAAIPVVGSRYDALQESKIQK